MTKRMKGFVQTVQLTQNDGLRAQAADECLEVDVHVDKPFRNGHHSFEHRVVLWVCTELPSFACALDSCG